MTTATALDVEQAAAELHEARLARRTVPTLTSRWPGMDVDAAYAVQAAGIEARLADGERTVGGKLGFTSAAMRAAMGVDSPNYGWITDAMLLHDRVAPRGMFIHPKVEPEIAFLLAADVEVAADGSATTDDVLAASSHVAPCLEVVDSRYQGFRFGPLDNIADDSSAGGVVLGDPTPIDGLDLRTLGVVVEDGGRVVHTAAGAAAHDHPAAAVAWMARAVATVPGGRRLRAGDVVISGGLTGPVDLRRGGVVTASFAHLGTVTVRMPPD